MKIELTYKGKFGKNKGFANTNIAKNIEANTRRMLRNVGEKTAEEMKRHTRPYDWKGRLTDSITWRTRYEDGQMGGKAESEDLISAPRTPDTVDIGTANYMAMYREFGAGVHVTGDRKEFFKKNLREWFDDKIGGTDQEFYAIMNSIRFGQKAQDGEQGQRPFATPTRPYLEKIAARETRFAGFERNMKWY